MATFLFEKQKQLATIHKTLNFATPQALGNNWNEEIMQGIRRNCTDSGKIPNDIYAIFLRSKHAIEYPI